MLYALLAYWRAQGWIAAASPSQSAGYAERCVAVSGPVSPDTAAQIAWACDNGFGWGAFDATAVVDPLACAAAEETAIATASALLGTGQAPLIGSAKGPDDPAMTDCLEAAARAGLPAEVARERIGAIRAGGGPA